MSDGERAPGGGKAQCNACSGDIVWFRTAAGKNVAIDGDGVNVMDLQLDRTRHVAHLDTCPSAYRYGPQQVTPGAVISSCRRYRYRLSRIQQQADQVHLRTILWLMLNPSTADGSLDDATIRRCRGFASTWGYGRILVGNLFAWRATDPQELETALDPIGQFNDDHLRAMALMSSIVVCAWGAHPMATPARVRRALEMVRDRPVYCLGRTKAGAPRHPLYVSGTTPLQEFTL